jgi:HAD superfamily hydrolase (TIGR01509 family)
MDLVARRFWVFDMDGTLTVPMHDFAWLRAQLEIPDEVDILDEVNRRPSARAARDRAFIDAWELDLARRAEPMDDAVALLQDLAAAGRTLGVLTRNTRAGARITLAAAGLARFFAEDAVIGRDCAPPKPDPAGVRLLLDRWGAAPSDAVVVGDWVYDTRAGRAAGAATVLVTRHGPGDFAEEADLVVGSLYAVPRRV